MKYVQFSSCHVLVIFSHAGEVPLTGDLYLVDEVVDEQGSKDHIICRMVGAVEDQEDHGSAVGRFEVATTKNAISMTGNFSCLSYF